MEVLRDGDGRSAGHRNFAAARLGDARRTAALVATADRILAHPPGTLPRKLGDPAALTRAYRLLRHPMVTHASVLAPHDRATLAFGEVHERSADESPRNDARERPAAALSTHA